MSDEAIDTHHVPLADECPENRHGHTVREHETEIDEDTGMPTLVAVCVHCGRPQWRSESAYVGVDI